MAAAGTAVAGQRGVLTPLLAAAVAVTVAERRG